MKRYLSVALVLLLIAFFSSKYSVEGRSLSRLTNSSQAMRDFQTRKDMKEAKPLVGENDSLRKECIKCNRPIVVEGSRKQQITTARKP
ncbi:hypothetical protein Bca52824_034034 [Brassica carinata]|uniref:Uncharacterized protein n=1 Tax=Brassica carinata TaxID=52824 RepID=A0A8X7SFQ0_BRACI|nr:hypothetical protein Bca52824_034034 [Brassica carinata]